MNWTISGLPIHVLLVHFTVVVIPVAALALIVSAFWPAARRRLGLLTPILALAALIAVPLTVSAGRWLYDRVEHTAAAKAHESIGTSILPWVIAMFVVATLQWTWHRFAEKRRSGSKAGSKVEIKRALRLGTAAVLTAAVLVSAVGSVVTVVRIGDSGATAAWNGNFES